MTDPPIAYALDAGKLVAGALIGVAVKQYFEAKAKLVSFYGHVSSFTFRANGEPFTIHSHEVVVRNTGRKAATNVRFSHAVLPDAFDVSPSVPYTVETLPDGSKDIVFPLLIPKQQITVAYLYPPPTVFTNVNTAVVCDSGGAQQVQMEVSKKMSTWASGFLAAMLIVGMLTTMYGIVVFGVRVFR